MVNNPRHFESVDEAQLLKLAAELSVVTPQGSIIYLQGELGAGKTTFARGFLRGCGYQKPVKSPTYNIVEIYDELHPCIYHFDLYRINDIEELELIGIREYFNNSVINLIEWPDNGQPLIPAADLELRILVEGEQREVIIHAISEKGVKSLIALS